jgi:hypothetical protein
LFLIINLYFFYNQHRQNDSFSDLKNQEETSTEICQKCLKEKKNYLEKDSSNVEMIDSCVNQTSTESLSNKKNNTAAEIETKSKTNSNVYCSIPGKKLGFPLNFESKVKFYELKLTINYDRF